MTLKVHVLFLEGNLYIWSVPSSALYDLSQIKVPTQMYWQFGRALEVNASDASKVLWC